MSAILQQLAVADLLIEQRMKFEDLFVQINRLPPHHIWSEFEQQGGEKYQNACEEAQKALNNLFNELIKVEQVLDEANPNLLAKSIEDEQQQQADHNQNYDSHQGFEDPEIAEENGEEDDDDDDNDEDEEEEDQLDDEQDVQMHDFDEEKEQQTSTNELTAKDSKRMETDEDLNEYLKQKHEKLNQVRDEILDFWFQKTRYTLKGGKLDKNSLDSFEQSAIRSIEFALQNRLKLIRRTQLKRSKYQIFGLPNLDEEQPKSELVERKAKEIYECEIFDDSDFYHQLLRELIGNLGPSTSSSSTKVNPKWLKLMKERFKTKKNVDTKATKARKIRYKVHDDLVNFMTPMVHLCTYNENQTNHLFRSLFGNRPTADEDDEEDEDLDSDDE
jgi:protein AATF/BFR2